LGENSESANNSELKPQFIDDDDLPFWLRSLWKPSFSVFFGTIRNME
jgi:hypothetical protein